MPGFIDCHVHMSTKLPSAANATEDWLTHSDIDRAFDGAVFARQMLQQGFTSARDVGGGDDMIALRDAINAAKTAGPRLWVALEPLSPTAGHGDPRGGLDPLLSHPGWDNGIVDSPEEGRRRVREYRLRGADLIKIMPSGGISSTGDNPRQQLMTTQEMRAIVESAHGLGLKVAAHIHPADVIENAVLAGVDSVEHGAFGTAHSFALMRAYGTYLVPTLTVYEVFYAVARDHPEMLKPGTPAKELANDLLPKQNLPTALAAGVKIAYGTDIGEGDHAAEFGLLIAAGHGADRCVAGGHPKRSGPSRRIRSNWLDPTRTSCRYRGYERRSVGQPLSIRAYRLRHEGRARLSRKFGTDGGRPMEQAVTTLIRCAPDSVCSEDIMLTPFHVAVQVRSIAEAREFYGDILGCAEGRSDDMWVDFNLYRRVAVRRQLKADRPNRHPLSAAKRYR
jgi:imidazolonepropionase-like amidohydrolase